jgi:thiamine biosynthesis lipoprotein
MGTRFELLAHHGDAVQARAAAEAAFEEVLRLHVLWSPFEKSSTIAHVNAGGGRAVRVDRDTLELLVAARGFWRDTGGRFDPTIGGLMRWLGFRGGIGGRVRGEARPIVGMQHVEIDERSGTVTAPGIELDAGSIAKGAALDAAGCILRDAGICSALLHAGTSSVLAIGSPPEMPDGWRVRVGGHAGAPEVVLRDESLSVSAPSGRVIETEDGEVGHVLDPRTGEPASGSKLAAVICASAMAADAWSTACLIGGVHPPANIARWAYVLPAFAG